MKWIVSSKTSLTSIIFAIILVLSTRSRSQTAEWTVYNINNSGLPNNKSLANGLAIDAQGNVWIGTGDWVGGGGGLAKFDGENWTVYTTGNSGLPYNGVFALAIDAQEDLWIGTGDYLDGRGGLAKFDGENWTAYNTVNSGLPSKDVSALAFDTQGNLWIGTCKGGLAKFDGANWTVYNTGNSGLPYNNVDTLSFDSQGNLWIGTVELICGQEGGGLVKFDGENWTVYNKANSGLTSNDIWALAFDAQGNLWIGTGDDYHPDGGGLVKFDGENWTVYHTSNSPLTWHMVTSLAVDAQDNVWMGMCSGHTTTGGLAKFDGENWWVFNKQNSGLPHHTATGLAFDAQGNVWVGTYGGGLAFYLAVAQPVFDFNGDEIVDSADVCMMIDYWGTDEPFFDIAPPPSGDGIVDIQDLVLLSEHLFEEIYPVELLAYWKLDEAEGTIAYNSVGNNDGFLFGDPIWQPTEGKRGGSLELDGIDDHFISDFILSPIDGPFSVFTWIKGGAAGQVIVSQADGTGSGETWLGITASDGSLMTGLVPPPVGRFLPQPLESQSVITDGQWHHVGFVWDGAYRCLYIDGTEIARDTKALTIAPLKHSNGGLYIGTSKTVGAGTFFSGLIDDIRIYNVALTTEEITALTQ